MAQTKPGPMVVLTGAGISAESGVPTFRGQAGLCRDFRPDDLATPRAFRRDPGLVWEWTNWRRGLISACEPNAAHRTLEEMEASLPDFSLITQNVDGLHPLAGSRKVLELHSNIWRTRCTRCDALENDRRVPLPEIPPRCSRCGALLRPDVVWFGESLPEDVLEAAWAAASRYRLVREVGTSAMVDSAALLPPVALRSASSAMSHSHRTGKGKTT